MHRIMRSAIVLSALGLLLSTAEAQRRASSIWVEDPAPAFATGLARLQAEFFVVSGPEEKLTEFDSADKADAESPAKLLKSLGRFGRAEMIGRFDQTVDLAEVVTFTSESRVPVRVPGPARRGGQAGVSISYESVGCRGKLEGHWLDESDPPTALVDADLRASWIAVSDEAPLTEEEREERTVPQAVSGTADIREEVELAQGQPRLLMGEARRIQSSTGGGDTGAGMRFIVRLLLTRIEEPPATAPAEQKKDTDSGQTMISVVVYEVTGSPDKILGLRPDEQIPPDLDDETVLAKLREHGEVEILSRPNILVAWPQSGQVSVGERVPVAAAVSGQTEYEEIGVRLTIDGEWLDEVDKELAQIRCRVETSRLYAGQRRTAAGQTTAAPRIVRTDRRYRGDVWEGEWSWLPRQVRSTSGDREKLSFLLTRMRIQRVRALANDPGPQHEAPAAEAGQQRDEIDPVAAPSDLVRTKVHIYHVRGEAKTLEGLAAEALEDKTESAEILQTLGRFGVATELVGSEIAIGWAKAEMIRQEVGEEGEVILKLAGRWMEGSPPRRAFLMLVADRAQTVPSKLGAVNLNEERQDTAHSTMLLTTGQPRWLSFADMKWQDAGQGDGESDRILVRLEIKPTDPGQPPARVPVPPPQATRLAVELLELKCPIEALQKLDFSGLARGNRTREQILAALKGIGEVESRRKLETTLDDLREELSITSGTRVPTVQDIAVSSSGQVTPSVNYEEVGSILEVQGRWLHGEQRDQAILEVSLDDSDIVDSSVAIGAGHRLPCFSQMDQEQVLRLTSGVPVLLASLSAVPASDDDPVRLGLALITATRMGGGDVAVDRRERTEARLALMKAAQLAHMRLDVFEVPMAKDALAGLDASTLRMAGSTEELLRRLQKLGQPKLRYCAERPVVLTEPARLVCGARVPTVRDVVRSARGQTAPSVYYQEVGYILELGGRWREDLTNTADLALEFECSGIKATSMQVAEGVKLPAFGQSKLSHQTRVRSGEPVILLATDMPVPGDTKTLPRLMVFRLVVSRDER